MQEPHAKPTKKHTDSRVGLHLASCSQHQHRWHMHASLTCARFWTLCWFLPTCAEKFRFLAEHVRFLADNLRSLAEILQKSWGSKSMLEGVFVCLSFQPPIGFLVIVSRGLCAQHGGGMTIGMRMRMRMRMMLMLMLMKMKMKMKMIKHANDEPDDNDNDSCPIPPCIPVSALPLHSTAETPT